MLLEVLELEGMLPSLVTMLKDDFPDQDARLAQVRLAMRHTASLICHHRLQNKGCSLSYPVPNDAHTGPSGLAGGPRV